MNRAAHTRIGQAPPTDRSALPTGALFVCSHPYSCDLSNLFPDGTFGLVGRVLAGNLVAVAPPSWYVNYQGQLVATNRMGNQILVRAMTPYGVREGWTLSQYLRAYAAPGAPTTPVRRDPRTPVSERVLERVPGRYIPTEVLR